MAVVKPVDLPNGTGEALPLDSRHGGDFIAPSPGSRLNRRGSIDVRSVGGGQGEYSFDVLPVPSVRSRDGRPPRSPATSTSQVFEGLQKRRQGRHRYLRLGVLPKPSESRRRKLAEVSGEMDTPIYDLIGPMRTLTSPRSLEDPTKIARMMNTTKINNAIQMCFAVALTCLDACAALRRQPPGEGEPNADGEDGER